MAQSIIEQTKNFDTTRPKPIEPSNPVKGVDPSKVGQDAKSNVETTPPKSAFRKGLDIASNKIGDAANFIGGGVSDIAGAFTPDAVKGTFDNFLTQLSDPQKEALRRGTLATGLQLLATSDVPTGTPQTFLGGIGRAAQTGLKAFDTQNALDASNATTLEKARIAAEAKSGVTASLRKTFGETGNFITQTPLFKTLFPEAQNLNPTLDASQFIKELGKSDPIVVGQIIGQAQDLSSRQKGTTAGDKFLAKSNVGAATAEQDAIRKGKLTTASVTATIKTKNALIKDITNIESAKTAVTTLARTNAFTSAVKNTTLSDLRNNKLNPKNRQFLLPQHDAQGNLSGFKRFDTSLTPNQIKTEFPNAEFFTPIESNSAIAKALQTDINNIVDVKSFVAKLEDPKFRNAAKKAFGVAKGPLAEIAFNLGLVQDGKVVELKTMQKIISEIGARALTGAQAGLKELTELRKLLINPNLSAKLIKTQSNTQIARIQKRIASSVNTAFGENKFFGSSVDVTKGSRLSIKGDGNVIKTPGRSFITKDGIIISEKELLNLGKDIKFLLDKELITEQKRRQGDN